MADGITKQEMEELLRNQATTFAGLLKGNNYSGSSKPAASGGGSMPGLSLVGDLATGSFKVLGATVEETAKAVGALGTGSYTARDALTSFSNVVSQVAPGFGGAMGKMGGAILDANDRLKESAKVGVDFAGDLGKMNKAVVDSGASQQQMADELRKNASQYSGAGVTMNKAIENVLGFSRDLQETPAIEQMKKAGTTQQEVAELAMISMKERRGIDLNDKAARQDMLDNTIALSGEMNEVARLTGVSRQEQMAKLAKDKENVVVQAELMGMDKDATNRYDVLKTKLGPLGDSVSKLADELFTGGIRTKEGADRMAALGPAGKQFEAAVLMQKNATTQAGKEAAAAAMEKAKQDIAAYQKTEQYLSQVKYDKSSVGDEARKIMSENKELKGRQTAEATAASAAAKEGKPGATPEQIQQARVAQAKQDTARVDSSGKPIAGAAISSAVNQFDQRLFQESKKAAELFQELNTQIGTLVRDKKSLQDALNPRVKAGGEEVRRENTKDGTAIGAVEDKVKELFNAEEKKPSQGAVNRNRARPPVEEPVAEAPVEAPVTTTPRTRVRTRAEGGPVDENTPYWVGEDGPELVTFDKAGTVVPTDKVETAGKKATAAPDMGPDFGSTLIDMMPDFSAMGTDLSSMFGDLTTKISDSTTSAFSEIRLPELPKVETPAPTIDAEAEATKARNRAEADAAPSPKLEPESLTASDGTTLSDLKEQLVQLNTAVMELISHSAQTAENSGAAVKATKDLSGNLYT